MKSGCAMVAVFAMTSVAAVSLLDSATGQGAAPGEPEPRRATTLPDLSGLAWVGDDRFLCVHDAKAKDEAGRPRASVLQLPSDLDGVHWTAQGVAWKGSESNDLESVAAIPGTDHMLLVESGDSGKGTTRMFLAGVDDLNVEVRGVVEWPVAICNIEATAVARVGDGHLFIYAERDGTNDQCKVIDLCNTTIRWAPFNVETMTFGAFESANFKGPDPRTNRPVVGLEVDEAGQVYIVSAFDPETAGLPDPDNGPYYSSVWRIGTVDSASASLTLSPPALVGYLSGVKTESVAVRPDPGKPGAVQVFVGTDDENYGGILRMLPPSDLADACP